MPRVITLSGLQSLGAAQPPFRMDWGPHAFVSPSDCQNPVLPSNKGCGTPLECAVSGLKGPRIGGVRLGQVDEATSAPWYESPVARAAFVAAAGASAYHGYKRNNSIGWAIWWGLMGGLFPIITVPVALAQGFGKRG